jgi:hypothetical protein
MKNIEKYQSMTTEEFADWLAFVIRGCAGCKTDSYDDNYCPFGEETCPYMASFHLPFGVYKRDLIEWLESEVDAS